MTSLQRPGFVHSAPGIAESGLLRRTLQAALADRPLWEPLIQFDSENRWYQRLEPTLDFDGELWLISWLPGQTTGLHDHGDSAGAFVVVEGELTEDFVDVTPNGLELLRVTRRVGAPRVFGHRYLHNVINTSDTPAVTVHAYTPELTFMTTYAWGDHGPEALRVQRVGEDW